MSLDEAVYKRFALGAGTAASRMPLWSEPRIRCNSGIHSLPKLVQRNVLPDTLQ
jgi:hypothetical protein